MPSSAGRSGSARPRPARAARPWRTRKPHDHPPGGLRGPRKRPSATLGGPPDGPPPLRGCPRPGGGWLPYAAYAARMPRARIARRTGLTADEVAGLLDPWARDRDEEER